MGKHFSKSYQPTPAAQATLAPQEQQLSKTHSKKNTNVLLVNKFLGLPEGKSTHYPTAPTISAFPKSSRMTLRSKMFTSGW